MRFLKFASFAAVLLLLSIFSFEHVTASSPKAGSSQQPSPVSTVTIDNQRETPNDQKEQKEQKDQFQAQGQKNGKILDLGSMACPPRGNENCRQKETNPSHDEKTDKTTKDDK